VNFGACLCVRVCMRTNMRRQAGRVAGRQAGARTRTTRARLTVALFSVCCHVSLREQGEDEGGERDVSDKNAE